MRANTNVMTVSQIATVRVSISRWNISTRPFHTSAYTTKLMEPSIMRTISTTSMGNE